ncbi:MAG TPA: hypothetical protein VLH41_08280, partial [Thermoanaerobaculia bacterium]|nr:hypothetical protein [Thermoanaerobaculia bacterium]
LEAGPAGRVILLSAASKGWRARKSATRDSAEIPGTAVRWEDGLFEVLDVLALPDGEVRYELAPWDVRHSARHAVTYDEAAERRHAAEHRDDRRREDRFALAVVFSPILGLLPSALQQKIEDETAFPATRLTLVSAIPLALFGFYALLGILLGAVGGPPLLPAWLSLPGVYLLLESGARIGVAVGQGRPVGSFGGEVFAAVARAVHRLARSAAGRPVERKRSFWEVDAPNPGTALRDLYWTREPLLALLSEDEQALLAELYGFDRRRWGRTTAIFLLVAFTPLVFAFVGGFLMVPELSDVPGALVSSGIVAEQLLRLWKLRRAPSAPSVLRFIVRPFCARLLGTAI